MTMIMGSTHGNGHAKCTLLCAWLVQMAISIGSTHGCERREYTWLWA